MKTKIKIAVIAITGFVLTIKAQTGEGDNYFNGNNFYKGISWQAIKSRFYSYGGNGSEAKWLLHNIPEQGGRFVVVAGPVGQTGNSNVAFSIEGNKSALFTGNVGIGITSPDKQLTVNSQIKILKSGDARTSGDKAELIFGEKDSDSYSGNIRIENTNSNPGYVNPKMVFSLQDYNSSTLDKVIDRMTILPNGNVGIGTSSPKSNLHIVGEGMIQSYSPMLKLRRDTNTGGFIQGIQTEYLDGTPNFYFGNIHGEEWVVVKGQYNGQRLFTIKKEGNVGIGTITTGSHKLAVEGSIGAREIKVEASGWSDFVFEKEYELPTLKEVESYIKEKGHLKDIPSAKEVEKNGFYLGEMDAKLLQKIEELTLYTIQQEKKLQSQDEKIKTLEVQNNRIEKLEEENKKLKILLEKVNRLEKLLQK